MNGAELFVKCLEAEGVERIYGVPGEENADFMMALEDSHIDFVLCRHEQAAAFMADVEGRLTGKPGVCLGTLGPGATNLVTGVADANMDRAPLIVITGQADTHRQHKESHQNMDVVAMFGPMTKWATPILHPDNIPEIIRKAFKIATTEKPGAVHIELAENVAEMEATGVPLEPRVNRRPVPADKVVDQAMELLRTAKNPIILAGNGAIRKRSSKMLRDFCKSTGIGVINTFMGKGAVARDDEHCLYTVGLQSRDMAMCAIDEADVVLSLGYDLVEYHPRLWNAKGDKKIIHVDFLPAEVDANYFVSVEVVGDIAHALWMMNERVKTEPMKFDLPLQRRVREELTADFAIEKDDDSDLVKPQKVLWDVREAMGSSDILLSDVGAHKMWVARYYQCDEPNTCLISNGFCTMGFAMPGAIGAKINFPEKKVLAICGDAGFLMNVQELETAKRIGANIVVMVWEDNEYGLIAWKQKASFGKCVDLKFDNPNFVGLAESFGWKGIQVKNSAGVAPALAEAFAHDGPTLIAVPIDYDENMKLSERLGNIACPI